MSSNAESLARGWWVSQMQRDEEGNWDIVVQFADGSKQLFHLLSTRDLDLVLADAVAKHLAGDRRWTRRSERGRG